MEAHTISLSQSHYINKLLKSNIVKTAGSGLSFLSFLIFILFSDLFPYLLVLELRARDNHVTQGGWY